MPFSFSQYSNTAKKSAFIRYPPQRPHEGNKKVGKFESSDFGALANQQFVTVQTKDKFSYEASQAAIPSRNSRDPGAGTRHRAKTFKVLVHNFL